MAGLGQVQLVVDSVVDHVEAPGVPAALGQQAEVPVAHRHDLPALGVPARPLLHPQPVARLVVDHQRGARPQPHAAELEEARLQLDEAPQLPAVVAGLSEVEAVIDAVVDDIQGAGLSKPLGRQLIVVASINGLLLAFGDLE